MAQSKSVKRKFSILEFIKILLSCITIALICFALFNFNKMYEKAKTIAELQGIIKNLKNNHPIASMTLLSKEENSNELRIKFFNASGELAGEPQTLIINGENIYIDCIVYNFTYSLIETGEVQNIAVPVRIYSNTIAPDEGIPLNSRNNHNIPYSLYLTGSFEDQAFHDLQLERLQKLIDIIENPEHAQELGIIRSVQRSAVANASDLRINKPYSVMVENTGGITLQRQ